MKVKELEDEIKNLKSDIKAKNEARSNTEKRFAEAAIIAEKEKSVLQNEIARLQDELLTAANKKTDDDENYKKELLEEIEKLKDKLEKSKAKAKTLKAELDQANEKMTEAAQKAVEEANTSALAEASKKAEAEAAEKISALEAEKKEREEEIARLEKKLSASSDDTLLRLNIKVQGLQADLRDIKSLLDKLEPETASKIRTGLKQIIENYKELIE